MNDENEQGTTRDRLMERDRAFLRDIEQINWLNHYVVADSLNRTGAQRLEDDHEHTTAGSIVRWNNHDTNATFFDRESIEVTSTLVAQVQAVAMLHIFQERAAAIESLGALLCSIKHRADGGIALRYYAHEPRHITNFYREVLDSRGTPLWTRLGWPPPEVVKERDAAKADKIVTMCEWLTVRVEEVAEGYLRPDGVTVVRLGDSSIDADPRSCVYVILGPEEWWGSRRRIDDGLMANAYGSLKHGFSATGLYMQYAQASRACKTLMALQVPKSPQAVQRFGQEINLVGKSCQEIARLTLEFDEWGALRSPDQGVPSTGSA
jgi:hypothetical protein